MKRQVLAVSILSLFLASHVFAVLAGGGTQLNPYLIQSRADFDEFANSANAATYWASGVYTKLVCNLNLADTTYTQAVIAPDENDTYGNGFQGPSFGGIFDGNSHVISNLSITASAKDYVAFFGCIYSPGQVKNLSIENANITGRDDVGSLVGANYNGTITSCDAAGTVSGFGYVGGMVGVNGYWSGYATITSSYATCVVSGTGYPGRTGGLVGENYYGTISSCYATGTVSSASSHCGGLVGENDAGSLTACYATGSVSGLSTVGGLVGGSSGSFSTITSCYATGTVSSAGGWIGGLIGRNSSQIAYSYSVGDVTCITSASFTGGLVGEHFSGTITACYATGAVNGYDSCGGLVGKNSGTITLSFWDKDSTGQSASAGGTGKTTAEMKMLSTFTSAGWDFVDIWAIGQNQTYPYLRTRPSADLNSDGAVDMADFAIFAAQWLEGI